MPVHLFGRPAPMPELVELGLPVIEDAAQAFGAPGVATLGAISTYSFFPTKNLFCLGDGGLVATNDEELADRVQMLSFHGSRDKSQFDFVGYNSRLDEMQAAFLRLFLEHIDEWNRGRREAAARYAELGLGELVELPEDEPGHIYHLFVCRSPERDAIRAALTEAGIALRVVLHHPAASAARAALPRLRARLAARDGARRAGELLGAALARDPGRGAGTGGGRGPLGGRRRLRAHEPAQPPPALAAVGGCGDRRRRLVPRVRAALRPRAARLLHDAAAPDAADRRRDPARGVHRVRLLQPLVALRVGERHVEPRARRRRRLSRRRRHRVPRLAGAQRAPAALDRRDRPAADARARPRRAAARADGDGAAGHRTSSRAARRSSSSARATRAG